MSKEDSPELTKSWVLVNNKNLNENVEEVEESARVQDVTENEPQDSDTDSISVISESGCSYKTDEEEFVPTEIPTEKDEEKENEESELLEKEPEIVSLQSEIDAEPTGITFDENKGIEKLMYFATSAVCAIILVGFSIAVQNYIQNASDLNNFERDQHIFPHVQNLKSENVPNKFHLKRKNQLKFENQHKIAKLQNDNEFHDKIAASVGDNDSKEEGNFKSNYKLNKNKNIAAKCNKENCDIIEKPASNDDDNIQSEELDQKMEEEISDGEIYSETYDKKVEKLKIKEDYLREKEKFLIEKEHDLLKKEIKLNKNKQQFTQNKHDKNTNKKGKKYSEESREFDSSEKKDKFKYKKNQKANNNKKEGKKQSPHKRSGFSDHQERKRNVSGHWYLNLHEARDYMRQKKRASFKRNKAHWYFQWMVDRARLRVK